MYDSKCKSCWKNIDTKSHDHEDLINDALLKLSKNKKIKFVSDEVYNFRLQQCMACEHLEYGSTCLKCGCFVQIRAKLADSGCPLSRHKRWNPWV